MIPNETPRGDLISMIELLTALVTSGLDTTAVMREVAQRAAVLTQADGAVVELVDGEEMVYSAVSGTAEGSLGLRLKQAASLSGLCVEQGVPLNCEDASTDERVDRVACERVGVGSMICVPLFHRGKAVGVLKVISSRKSAFNDTHARTLSLLATVIASSLAHADQFENASFDRDHDALTGLRNRRAYDAELAGECARSRRYAHPLTLALLDLNGFKSLNDTQGHPAGDVLLRDVAGVLRQWTRGADRCFRIGGDEFAVMFTETQPEAAEIVVARIKRAVEELGKGVSTSAGLAELSAWMQPAELHAAADMALYADKNAFQQKNGLRRA
jgi:diguanylate cyclase (GGDEF)-like protein